MSKNLYTLSLDSIKFVLGLIRDTVTLPETILDDLHIQSTTTYSSYKLDTLLKALKEENISYCDAAISGLNKLSKEIITDKSQITNENTIYLLLTDTINNVYEQWLLINGTPQMIGTTEMKLDNVYTKDEADARYSLLSDFNDLKDAFTGLKDKVGDTTQLKNATLIEDVQEALNNKGLISMTSEQYEQLKTNGSVVVDGETITFSADDYYVVNNDEDSVSISTTISSASTNTEIPTSKSIWDALSKKVDKALILSSVDTVNSFDRAYESFLIPSTISEEVGLPISPKSSWFCTHLSHAVGYKYPSQIAFEYAGIKRIMYRTSVNGVWGGWMKLCTTSVTDVPSTIISSFEDETYIKPSSATVCQYVVKNGYCNIRLETSCIATATSFIKILSGLPKPATIMYQNAVDRGMNGDTGARGVFQLSTTGDLWVVCNYGDTSISGTRNLYVSFSYPVAES